MVEHVVHHLGALLETVYLLKDTLVDRGALAAQGGRHLEVGPLGGREGQHLLRNRLQQLDALLVRLDVEVVVVALLLDPVEALFEAVLPVGHKARVLGSPGGMGGPLVV